MVCLIVVKAKRKLIWEERFLDSLPLTDSNFIQFSTAEIWRPYQGPGTFPPPARPIVRAGTF